jgi:SAM-dependent methyltransferase
MAPPTKDPDPLRPSAAAAAEAWAARVRDGREQVVRLREIDEPRDFYGPMASRFGQDPRRRGDAALEALRSMATPSQTWLDLGAGGGRYALPLALEVALVHAVEPSPSMVEVLRRGLLDHAIENVEVHAREWPMAAEAPAADVALMAHVGYDIERFGRFLDAAEQAAPRCVVVMRTGGGGRASHALWPEIHGEPRVAYPMLPELLVLLVARGVTPAVTLVDRATWGYHSQEQLIEALRRLLWLRPGSEKDRRMIGLVSERASERDGLWDLDWTPLQDGVVTWTRAS